MSLKEEFFALKSYDEYLENKGKFESLIYDREVIHHLSTLMGSGFLAGSRPEEGFIVDCPYKQPRKA